MINGEQQYNTNLNSFDSFDSGYHYFTDEDPIESFVDLFDKDAGGFSDSLDDTFKISDF